MAGLDLVDSRWDMSQEDKAQDILAPFEVAVDNNQDFAFESRAERQLEEEWPALLFASCNNRTQTLQCLICNLKT